MRYNLLSWALLFWVVHYLVVPGPPLETRAPSLADSLAYSFVEFEFRGLKPIDAYVEFESVVRHVEAWNYQVPPHVQVPRGLAQDPVAKLICQFGLHVVPTPGGLTLTRPDGGLVYRFVRGSRSRIRALGFEVSSPLALHRIRQNYLDHFPELILENGRTLTVHALGHGQQPDLKGPLLKFEWQSLKPTSEALPGGGRLENDHWVFNVHEGSLLQEILETCLEVEPKVQFDAGVISAGQASIVSVVMGSPSNSIFLPINQPKSPYGHVANFLRDHGNGIQHLAIRVRDLPAFVEHARKMRALTGVGLEFLEIPPNYYGNIEKPAFLGAARNQTAAREVWEALVEAQLLEPASGGLKPGFESCPMEASLRKYLEGARTNKLSRLLKGKIPPKRISKIADHQILADVQGPDVLLQIFGNALFPGSLESPFIEVIERHCQRPQRGCGGFGIRNFLTLFLSMEMAQAAKDLRSAVPGSLIFQQKTQLLDIYRWQLQASQPYLDILASQMSREATQALKEIAETANQKIAHL